MSVKHIMYTAIKTFVPSSSSTDRRSQQPSESSEKSLTANRTCDCVTTFPRWEKVVVPTTSSNRSTRTSTVDCVRRTRLSRTTEKTSAASGVDTETHERHDANWIHSCRRRTHPGRIGRRSKYLAQAPRSVLLHQIHKVFCDEAGLS